MGVQTLPSGHRSPSDIFERQHLGGECKQTLFDKGMFPHRGLWGFLIFPSPAATLTGEKRDDFLNKLSSPQEEHILWVRNHERNIVGNDKAYIDVEQSCEEHTVGK